MAVTRSNTPAPSAYASTWPLALLAVVLPTVWPWHRSPSITFMSQLLAVTAWGLWALMLTLKNPDKRERVLAPQGTAMTAWSLALWLVAGSAIGSAWFGGLTWGLAMMAAAICLSAWWLLQTGWRSGLQGRAPEVMDLVAMGLTGAAWCGVVLGSIQVFWPEMADGDLIARSVVAGRAVGNLRQPNHLSTLMVMGLCGAVWLGRRGRLPVWLSALTVALSIGVVVGTASRTGMVGMGLLLLWGARDRGLPRMLRLVLVAAPVLYAAWWGALALWADAGSGHAFAAQARLHDGSDISSSRFAIWANTLELIRMHPWTGVGWGMFNAAWTFTPFPGRPVAFFDHTHNIVLQWAVELGIPMAIVLTALCAIGSWPLLKAWWQSWEQTDDVQGAQVVAAVVLAMLALHSLLEYPLWYTYFLLPLAFVVGTALAPHDDGAAGLSDGTRSGDVPLKVSARWEVAPAVVMLLGSIWCGADFQVAANIYEPPSGAAPLAQRIATGRHTVWFAYQADYAWVTDPAPGRTPRPPAEYRRTVYNLIDGRLMVAYARSLAAHGQVDKARYVVERMKEFRHAPGQKFLEVCDTPASTGQLPFQCTPPVKHYTWQQILP